MNFRKKLDIRLLLCYYTSLTSITFNGTKAQRNAISKGSKWDNSTGSYTIHCTDGNISK